MKIIRQVFCSNLNFWPLITRSHATLKLNFSCFHKLTNYWIGKKFDFLW